MSEEEKSEKAEDAAAEAKGIAEQFVQTLGLLDIILGGLFLYWVRLWFRDRVTSLLESTGYVWVDIALLACAAALTGKVLSLLSKVLTALVELIIQSWNPQKSFTSLRDALTDYRRGIGHQGQVKDSDVIDTAATYAVKTNPRLRAELEGSRATSTFSYSAIALSFLFMLHFVSKAASAGPIILVFLVLLVAFILTALIAQINFLVRIRETLNAYLPVKPEAEGGTAAARASTPLNVNLSAPNPIALSLKLDAPIGLNFSASEPISVEFSPAQRPLIKEKTMKFTIETSERLRVLQATRLLTAFALLDEALSIESDEDAERMLARLDRISFTTDPIREAHYARTKILALGFSLQEYDEEGEINDTLRDMIAGVLVGRVSREYDLELVSLREGSEIGIIRKALEHVYRRIFRAFSASKSLLPQQDGAEYRQTVAALVRERNLRPEAAAAAIGVGVIAGKLLKDNYKEMKATGLSVDESLDDDEAPPVAATV